MSQKYQVAGTIRATKKETTIEVTADSQQAAEDHVAAACPNIDVKKTDAKK